ncbi:MAG: DNA topoisomerase, partial [Thalassolituus sp.]
LRKVLKDTDGLGTEATRAGIIELLFKRGFLQRQGKQILATETGTQLIEALPEQSTLPDMTALWEQRLEAISQREYSYDSFMEQLDQQLGYLVEMAKSASLPVMKNSENKTSDRKKYTRKKSSGATKSYSRKAAKK